MSAPEVPAPAAAPAAAPLPAPRRRSPWLTVLLCLAIFVSGGVVGAGAMAIHVYRTAAAALQHPERTPGRIALRLQRRFDLTDEQASRVEAILRHRQAALVAARADMLQRAAPELDALEDEVAAELQPGQALRWREQFRRLRHDWGSGPKFVPPGSQDR